MLNYVPAKYLLQRSLIYSIYLLCKFTVIDVSDGNPTKEPVVNATKGPVVIPNSEPVVNPTKEPVVNATKEPVVNPTKEPDVNLSCGT